MEGIPSVTSGCDMAWMLSEWLTIQDTCAMRAVSRASYELYTPIVGRRAWWSYACLPFLDERLRVHIRRVKDATPSCDMPHPLPLHLTELCVSDSFNQPMAQLVDFPLLTRVTFGDAFNQPLSPGDLPEGLKYLFLGDGFNKPLPPGAIPDTVQNLTIGDGFDCALDPGCLPRDCVDLYVGDVFSRLLLPGVFPPGLKYLVLCGYDRPLLPGVIPDSVEFLSLGFFFNQELEPGVLPTELTHLVLDGDFNQTLQPEVLPTKLTHLSLGDYQLVHTWTPDTLPRSLTSLKIGGGGPDLDEHPVCRDIIPNTCTLLNTRQSAHELVNWI